MVDGVGLAAQGSTNPVASGFTCLSKIIGHPFTDALRIVTSQVLALPIDASMGVAGRPQSGSGHAAIYGGFNAAALNGRHQPSYPSVAMREQLARHNLLLAARQVGCAVAWANAYLPGYEEAVANRRQRHTAGTWCALQSGLKLRGVQHLIAGSALSWDVTQRLARTRPGATMLPEIAPEEAGERLAVLAKTHELVAYETYLPDLAGHERIPVSVAEALQIVDGLLAGVLASKSAADTVIVTSDHGNSEDMTTRVHTINPVPLLVFGPAAPLFADVRAIEALTPTMLGILKGG
jgi:hypothetical protein